MNQLELLTRQTRDLDEPRLQLESLVVEDLFGKLHHSLSFPSPTSDDPGPSLVILHGPNGVEQNSDLHKGFVAGDFAGNNLGAGSSPISSAATGRLMQPRISRT